MEYLTNKQMVLNLYERISGSLRPILFLDYDGTLAPFSVERDKAFPYEGVREAIEDIIENTRTRVVIVSGRPVDDLIPLLGLDASLEIFGSHGWERIRANGDRQIFPLNPEAKTAIDDARLWIKQNNLESRSELKPASVTLHWRGMTRAEEHRLHEAAVEAWTPYTRVKDIDLCPFDGGIELRALGLDKGDAVRLVLEEAGPRGVAAYLGDDLTDEDAFAALARQGLSVLVRPEKRETRADLWLAPPEELLQFLKNWKKITSGVFRTLPKNFTSKENAKTQRLMVVSNRLPVRMSKEASGWEISPSPGGLVTALTPILQRNHGTWIGWIGTESDEDVDLALEQTSVDFPYQLKSVPLTDEDVDLYYRGFSNETLWPLFHDLLGYCKFEKENWEKYCEINERFADKIIESAGPHDVIWVHDYQLCLVGSYLKKKGFPNRVIFFLHIPFPSSDLFRRLPWRLELTDALTSYDTLGFHTLQDRQNFVNTVCWMYDDVGVRERESITTLFLDGRRIRVGNWPISIDFEEFYNHAQSEEVAKESWLFHEHFEERKIIFGLDRLDYTKGIPERFEAFARFLEKYPEMHETVCLYQCVVPSRTHVPDYQDLKERIEMLVGRINGRYSKAGWVPIHYAYGSLTRCELLGRYHACELALITPLRDGMNLVCKEYISSCVDDRGVLILSEFAGAAEQLAVGALMVNPYDVEKTADTIYQALTMSGEERKKRIQQLREIIREHDVHRWVRSIFDAAGLSINTSL